jgi:hypothetical protein
MAMEIQIMRRAGYAMKIKTPAEAAGYSLTTNRKAAPAAGPGGNWILPAGRRRRFLKLMQHRSSPAQKKSFFQSHLRAGLG